MSGAGVPVWEAPASALASSERMREYSRRSLICRGAPSTDEKLTVGVSGFLSIEIGCSPVVYSEGA